MSTQSIKPAVKELVSRAAHAVEDVLLFVLPDHMLGGNAVSFRTGLGVLQYYEQFSGQIAAADQATTRIVKDYGLPHSEKFPHEKELAGAKEFLPGRMEALRVVVDTAQARKQAGYFWVVRNMPSQTEPGWDPVAVGVAIIAIENVRAMTISRHTHAITQSRLAPAMQAEGFMAPRDDRKKALEHEIDAVNMDCSPLHTRPAVIRNAITDLGGLFLVRIR